MNVITLKCNDELGENQVLRQKSAAIKNINDDIRKTAQSMIKIMQDDKGIGLAGPQIGLLKRIFVTHIGGDKPRVFINPSIIWTSQEEAVFEEGCLSVPGMYAEVKRPSQIKVQAWDEKGRAFTLDVSGLLARVIQHEYDHLEGILFIDRISEAERDKILAKLAKLEKRKKGSGKINSNEES